MDASIKTNFDFNEFKKQFEALQNIFKYSSCLELANKYSQIAKSIIKNISEVDYTITSIITLEFSMEQIELLVAKYEEYYILDILYDLARTGMSFGEIDENIYKIINKNESIDIIIDDYLKKNYKSSLDELSKLTEISSWNKVYKNEGMLYNQRKRLRKEYK